MIDSGRVERLYQLLRHRPVVATLVQVCREVGGVEAPVEAHLVGGLLRDRLLGLPSRDYDAVLSHSGRRVAAAVAERMGAHLVHLGGRDFAAYRVVGAGGDDWVLDLWDRERTSLAEDLGRRDFTVNSFALSLAAEPPAAGRLIDPHGGVADLGSRLLRATTEGSFSGDPLRVLRLPRLQVQLPGFAADPATLELARRSAAGLAGVASERVRAELVLLFQRRGCHRAFGLLHALAVYPGLWRGEPGVPASPAGDRRAGRALVELERLEPAIGELAALAAPAAPEVDRLAARYATTFAHLPRDEGSEAERTAAAAAAVVGFRDAGYLTRSLSERVRRLVADAALPPADGKERRRWLHRLGELWPTAVALAGARAGHEGITAWRREAAELARLAAAEGDDLLAPPKLLSGDEVQQLLDVPQGPRVGEALSAVTRAQVDGDVRTRDEAAALLKKLYG